MVTELTCSAALMDVNLSIKQPWHTEYCHIEFEYSDLSANYPTHYMLTLTKIYAVKTGQPRNLFLCVKYRFNRENLPTCQTACKFTKTNQSDRKLSKLIRKTVVHKICNTFI